jgi:hypothetical protein
MNRLLTIPASLLILGLAPALAVEDAAKPDPSATGAEAGQLPTQSGVSEDAAKKATEPAEGSADTSGGAMERSSAPPSSDAAATAKEDASKEAQSSDTSGGAKEQSSAPEGSSAADKSKPNPTIGSETPKEDDPSKE